MRIANWREEERPRERCSPSDSFGVAESGRADELPQTLKQALSLVEIKTLDHLIVARSRTISFAERGLL